MASERMESRLSLIVHPNQTGSQVTTNTGQVIKEFTDFDDYQVNLKAAEGWLAEQGFVHVGQSDYAKYDPLMTGDTSESEYE